jgi:hypothetical protein
VELGLLDKATMVEQVSRLVVIPAVVVVEQAQLAVMLQTIQLVALVVQVQQVQ